MSLPTIQEESWANMAGNKTPKVNSIPLSKPLSSEANEYVPLNENSKLMMNYQLRLANRPNSERKNIQNLKNTLTNIGTSNTRGNYNEKMRHYMRVKSAVPLETIERNLLRPKSNSKSRKSRKGRKSRKSRKSRRSNMKKTRRNRK